MKKEQNEAARQKQENDDDSMNVDNPKLYKERVMFQHGMKNKETLNNTSDYTTKEHSSLLPKLDNIETALSPLECRKNRVYVRFSNKIVASSKNSKTSVENGDLMSDTLRPYHLTEKNTIEEGFILSYDNESVKHNDDTLKTLTSRSIDDNFNDFEYDMFDSDSLVSESEHENEEVQIIPCEEEALEKSYHEMHNKPMSSTLRQNLSLPSTVERKVKVQDNIEQKFFVLPNTNYNMLKYSNQKKIDVKNIPNLSLKLMTLVPVAAESYARVGTANTLTNTAA